MRCPWFDQTTPEPEPPPVLPALSLEQQVVADYQSTGMSLKAHPLSFYRPQLDALKVATSRQLEKLRNGRMTRVAGLVLLRQRPSTAKGITFVTLEDETGTANLVVHQAIWERYYAVARRSPAWLAFGRVESKTFRDPPGGFPHRRSCDTTESNHRSGCTGFFAGFPVK